MTIKEKKYIINRDYPIGTVFESPYNKNQQTVKGDKSLFFEDSGNVFLYKGASGEALYFENKWAKIISSPKNKEIQLNFKRY